MKIRKIKDTNKKIVPIPRPYNIADSFCVIIVTKIPRTKETNAMDKIVLNIFVDVLIHVLI